VFAGSTSGLATIAWSVTVPVLWAKSDKAKEKVSAGTYVTVLVTLVGVLSGALWDWAWDTLTKVFSFARSRRVHPE